MTYQLIQGSAHHMPTIADGSVQAICTSPPYFGLRSYEGNQAIEWPTVEYAPMPGLAPICVPPMRCALGLENTIEAYIGHLILCLREWRRVLRDDGICFVNLGDSYAGGGTNRNGLSTSAIGSGPNGACKQRDIAHTVSKPVQSGLQPKNLMMIPARFALAAQADGWYLRSAIVWAKGVSFLPDYAGSCMPESVTDRPTQSYEMVYMLAKSADYFYDNEAVKEASKPLTAAAGGWQGRALRGEAFNAKSIHENYADIQSRVYKPAPTGRNLRSVWCINPLPYPGAHFACWPPALVEPMIKAGSRIADTVLDPFAGSGTTLQVAVRLGRHAIGVDLSAQYLGELVPERMDSVSLEPIRVVGGVEDWHESPLFAGMESQT